MEEDSGDELQARPLRGQVSNLCCTYASMQLLSPSVQPLCRLMLAGSLVCETPIHLCMLLVHVIAVLSSGVLCTCIIAKCVCSQHLHMYGLPQSAAMRVQLPQVWRPPQELIDSYSSGIEAVLGYKFQKRALLQEALTHTSWPDATQQVRGCPFCHASHFCTYFLQHYQRTKNRNVVSCRLRHWQSL